MLYNKNWQAPIITWQEVLLRAADLIEKDGWCRGTYHRGRGHCIVGAVTKVVPWGPLGRQAVTELTLHLGVPAIWYNDDSDRTREEVVAAMRAAASK